MNQPRLVSSIPVTPNVELAPFALLRVAAIGYRYLADMTPPTLTVLVNEILDVRQKIGQMRPYLEHALYLLIPQIDDRIVRRTAIALRRDIHTGRKPRISHDKIDHFVDSLTDENLKKTLRSWIIAHDEVHTQLNDSDEVYFQSIQSYLRPRLLGILQNPGFSRALAVASPDLLSALMRHGKKNVRRTKTSKEEHSLLRYLIRASAKTSPFSTFMHVIPLTMVDTWSKVEMEHLEPVRHCLLNRGVLTRLYKTAVCQGSASNAGLHLNNTIRDLGEGSVSAITGEYVSLFNRPWHHQRATRFRFNPVLIRRILQHTGTHTWDQWLSYIIDSGFTKEQARRFLTNLIDKELLWVEEWTDGYDYQPTNSLLKRLEKATTPSMAESLSVAIKEMHIATVEFGSAGGLRRTDLIKRIRTLENETNTSFGKQSADPFQDVIFEDSWMCGARGSIGGALPRMIGEVGSFLLTQIALKPEYNRLREAFLRRYGVGGCCTEVVGFLMAVGHKLAPVPEFGTSWNISTFDEEPIPASPGVKTGLTAYLHVVAADAKAAAAGDAVVMVNNVYERLAWQSARFAYGDHKDIRLFRRQVKRWLEYAYAPFEPVDLMLCGHCNNLQAHYPLTDRVFVWPGEPILKSRAGRILPNHVRMCHNTRTNMLELKDRDEKPFTLIYLGAATPTPTWGILFALTLLAQPFYVRRPNTIPDLGSTDDLIFQPRRCEGNLVLVRATWWLRGQKIRDSWFAKTGIQRLVDVAEFCNAHQLPTVFFVRAYKNKFELGQTTEALTVNKPLWIDIRNPYCLELLEKIITRAEWVMITEALPDENQIWTRIDKQEHVSELQVEMMITIPD